MKDRSKSKKNSKEEEPTKPKGSEADKGKKRKKEETTEEEKDEKPLEKAEEHLVNSTSHRKEWQQFKRWMSNKKRCPAKIVAACKSQAGPGSVVDYVHIHGLTL